MFENIDILSFPKAACTPGKEDELFRNLRFVPSQARKNGSIPGELSAEVEYGCFKVAWDVSLWTETNHDDFCSNTYQ